MHAARMAAEAEARGDTAKARFWLRIKARVDEAPPLSPEQSARLRILLAPAPAAQKQPAA
jgi:hypothetical protein